MLRPLRTPPREPQAARFRLKLSQHPLCLPHRVAWCWTPTFARIPPPTPTKTHPGQWCLMGGSGWATASDWPTSLRPAPRARSGPFPGLTVMLPLSTPRPTCKRDRLRASQVSVRPPGRCGVLLDPLPSPASIQVTALRWLLPPGCSLPCDNLFPLDTGGEPPRSDSGVPATEPCPSQGLGSRDGGPGFTPSVIHQLFELGKLTNQT